MQKASYIRFILLSFFILFPLLSFAEEVELAEARRVAAELLSPTTRSASPLTLRRRSSATYLFVCDSRFALVGADTRLPRVIAYGSKRSDELPPSLLLWLSDLDAALPYMSSLRPHSLKPLPPVAPLLTTVRHQKDPYNRLCPHYRYADGQMSDAPCLVGCVATALEQIFTFYRRDYTLSDTIKGYQYEGVCVDTIFPGAHVDTRQILDIYTGKESEKNIYPVALLSRWLGQAVRMNWGLDSSGANSEYAATAIQRIFGWKYVHFLSSMQYTPREWRNILVRELQEGRPIYYAGSVFWAGGHAFVIDGIDEDGLMHVNWGYGGNYDGYFNLLTLNFAEPPYDQDPQSEQEGFFCAQEAILLHPDQQYNLLNDTLKRYHGDVKLLSVERVDDPVLWQFTRYRLCFTNTTSHPLTTSLLAITNTPDDQLLLREGTFAANTSFSLGVMDTVTVTLYATLRETGRRLLHLTDDGEHFWTIDKMKLSTPQAPQLDFASPLLSFPNAHTLQVEETISNASQAGRYGNRIIYELIQLTPPPHTYPGVPIEGTRHGHRIFLKGGETKRDSVKFQHLIPGATYRLLVRDNWPIMQEVIFTMPIAEAIYSPLSKDYDEKGYDINGYRQIEKKGIYIENRKKYYFR